MMSENFSIIECIVFHDETVLQTEMIVYNQILFSYTDSTHSHYLIKGKCKLPDTWKHHILLTHSWRDIQWCMNRLKSQPEYHKAKSVYEELNDLFDYLEIPNGETNRLLQELEFNGRNVIASCSQHSDHTVIVG